MGEFGAGIVAGLLLGTQAGWAVEPGLLLGVLLGIGLYGGSCWMWPYRLCPWCAGDLKRGDGRGNYRLKSCWLCGGGRYVRFGARLLGRG